MGNNLDIIAIIGIALALSMDSLAVSIANGIVIKKLKFSSAFRISFSFGFFQAVMPLIGWAAGLTVRSYIQPLDHWIAFGLLLFIGVRMIINSLKEKENDKTKNCQNFPTLILLSIATSIDALAAGLSFAVLEMNIFYPVAIIGGITFINCFIGILIGKKIGHIFRNKIEIIGGIILIIIGLKILIEHLVYNI